MKKYLKVCFALLFVLAKDILNSSSNNIRLINRRRILFSHFVVLPYSF